MLEVFLIMSIIQACMLMPLRGKTIQQLNPTQIQRVEKNYYRYMQTRKGRKNPTMTIFDYLPILQKQALTHLITAIVILSLYALIVVFVWASIFLS